MHAEPNDEVDQAINFLVEGIERTASALGQAQEHAAAALKALDEGNFAEVERLLFRIARPRLWRGGSRSLN